MFVMGRQFRCDESLWHENELKFAIAESRKFHKNIRGKKMKKVLGIACLTLCISIPAVADMPSDGSVDQIGSDLGVLEYCDFDASKAEEKVKQLVDAIGAKCGSDKADHIEDVIEASKKSKLKSVESSDKNSNAPNTFCARQKPYEANLTVEINQLSDSLIHYL